MQMSASLKQRGFVHRVRARRGEIAAQCRIPLAECTASIAGVERELCERTTTDVVRESLQERGRLVATLAAKTIVDLETCLDHLGVGFETSVLGLVVRIQLVRLVRIVVAEAPPSRRGAASVGQAQPVPVRRQATVDRVLRSVSGAEAGVRGRFFHRFASAAPRRNQ